MVELAEVKSPTNQGTPSKEIESERREALRHVLLKASKHDPNLSFSRIEYLMGVTNHDPQSPEPKFPLTDKLLEQS